MIPRFKLGDWVRHDPEGADRIPGNWMVLDYIPGCPLMYVGRLSESNGQPFELMVAAHYWRLA